MHFKIVAILMLSCLFLPFMDAVQNEIHKCPAGCTCSNRQLRCSHTTLFAMPKQLPRTTAIIDLQSHRIRKLLANSFDVLASLSTINLAANELEELEENVFYGLTALRQLNLSNNRIGHLKWNIFKQLDNLEILYLDHNRLGRIADGTFRNLPRLNRLFLHNNQLRSIPIAEFNLASLRLLRFDNNQIECDCGVYALWLQWHEHPNLKDIHITLDCITPTALKGRSFQNFQENFFDCGMTHIVESPNDVQITVGEDVLMPCKIISYPKPEITWLYNSVTMSFGPDGNKYMMPGGSLIIKSAKIEDSGRYVCMGRSAFNYSTTAPAILTVMPISNNETLNARDNEIWNSLITHRPVTQSPAFPSQNQQSQRLLFIQTPHDQIVALNSAIPVLLNCAAVATKPLSTPSPEIQWFFNGRPVTQSSLNLQLLANGSLVLTELQREAAGVYRCEASNGFERIHVDAHIAVKELPEILLAPQSQTIKLGKPFTLECDADGNPLPTINWLFKGKPIDVDERRMLENENTELVVKKALVTDSGIYTCIMENENGRTTINATIVIEGARGIPRLLIEPYDLEAFTGTSIEIPCKSDESGVKILWRKDGRTIDPSVLLDDKFIISAAGSLFVKNVTIVDSGRYECSVSNEYGRSTASAVITIKNSIDLAPGDRYVRVAFAEAASEIDLAINNTIELLFNKRNQSNNGAPRNPGELLRVFRFPTGEARQLARAAEIYERTLVNIRKHVQAGDNLTVRSDKYEFRELLSREHLHLVAELSGCWEPREMPNCTDMCFHSRYRSIDGTCNNLLHPMWGASLTAFRRLAPPIYEDGFSMPIGWTKGKLYAGYMKPSARLVSTTLVTTKEITPDEQITHMVMQWGQFLDHDLDHAIPSVSSESWDGVDCKKTCAFAPPCYPIEVPPNDPRVHNRRCIDVVRSSAICGSGMTSVFFDSIQHREQINQLTAYIDASQMYGYSAPFAQELRNLSTDEGLLRVGVHFPHQKDMLPFAAPQDGMDCRRNLDENTMNCFVSGDIRVNEQIGLLAMHTIWMREHNRIAITLREINPHWDGDTLYQEARKIVGAQMQHITYQHWLPLIVGESGIRMLGPYNGYNSSMRPNIANEFATAALRFGHTLINPVLHRLDETFKPIMQGHLPLHKAFFAPWRLPYEGGVDPLMRGMFAVAAKLKTPTQNLNTELTEKLFHTAHAVALDLAAINIQRGRDHGIPGYNVYRKLCNLRVAQTFDDLSAEISNKEVRDKLQQLYGHPDNIDVWLGGVLEDQVQNGKVGPLFQCLLVEQFRRLRDGDRFYYENPGVFMPQQLEQIRQSNLGRVLCDTGDNINQITDNVFLMPETQGGFQNCENIPGINLYLWQDCGACNNLPPLFDTYIPETYVKSRNKRSLYTKEQQQPANEVDFDKRDERINELEAIIGDFQRELRVIQQKLHTLEQNTYGDNQEPLSPPEEAASFVASLSSTHCIDEHGMERKLNEMWSPDVCTKCTCKHGQVVCDREQCVEELLCDSGLQPITRSDACCAHCP